MAETVFQKGTKEIRLADKAGFCFGVKNAVDKAFALLDECGASGERVFATGRLIHNRTVTDELEAKGLRTVGTPGEAEPGARILIRAHGEDAAFYETCRAAGLRIEDMTCPFVARIHSIAAEAHRSGRGVVIVGDAAHPEVIGIRGWAGEPCAVISNLPEAEAFLRDLPEEGGWTGVSQTTFIEENWDAITGLLKDALGERIELRNTICSATRERQEGCRELAGWADCMVVLGDPASANTKKLLSIAESVCPNAFFAENKTDLPLHIIAGYDKIGVAAGASTPERIIKEVISIMS